MVKRQQRCSLEQEFKKIPLFPANTLQLDVTAVLFSDSVKNLAVLLNSPRRASSAKPNHQIVLLPAPSNQFCPEVYFHRGYSETDHLTHSVTPRLLQFSPFRPACFLDYCNSLLSGLPASSVQSLCRIQYCAARLTLKKRKTDHITPLFQFLHWLPVKQRIQYKINTLCYKCITGIAPSYLCDCLQLYTPFRLSLIHI